MVQGTNEIEAIWGFPLQDVHLVKICFFHLLLVLKGNYHYWKYVLILFPGDLRK